ncbi:MAG: glycosyltransferase [Candidatus Velthaea sp.]|jgi:glycosyltransferase involved in cell wall biosynthesis
MPYGRIRVVHLIANLSGGGAESFLRALTPRLVSDSTEVSIVAVYPSRLAPGEKERIGVQVIEIERRGRSDIWSLWRVVRVLRELEPEVVHTHVHTGKYLGRLAAILAGVPVIVFTEHNPDPPRGPIHAMFDRLLNARTSAIVTFTEHQRARVAREAGGSSVRVVVIPNGIPRGDGIDVRRAEVRRELGLATNEFALLCIGRLEPQKNQQLAIRALAHLRGACGVPVRLLLAGDGSLKTNLAALAAELGLSDCVTFLGFREDVPSLLRSVDMVLLSTLCEGMSIAAIEAMQSGTPIVSTPWEGAQAFFQDSATIAQGWDPAELALAVKEVMSDANLRSVRAARAKRIASEQYDIAATASAHLRLYSELVGTKA